MGTWLLGPGGQPGSFPALGPGSQAVLCRQDPPSQRRRFQLLITVGTAHRVRVSCTHTRNIHILPPPPVLKNPNPVISALYTLDTSNTRRLRKWGARDEQKGTTPYLAGIPTQLSNHLVPSWHLILSAGKERDPRPTGAPVWYSRTSQGQEEAETTCHSGHQRPLFPLTAEASAAVSTQLTRGSAKAPLGNPGAEGPPSPTSLPTCTQSPYVVPQRQLQPRPGFGTGTQGPQT